MSECEGVCYCNDMGKLVRERIWGGRKGNPRVHRIVSWNN